jgi:hypothetical protein
MIATIKKSGNYVLKVEGGRIRNQALFTSIALHVPDPGRLHAKLSLHQAMGTVVGRR